MTLWIVIGTMTAVAVALLLPALLRRAEAPPSRADYDMRIYRDQLAEIERDVRRGLVEGEQAEAARVEIGRRLLAASAAARGADVASVPRPRRTVGTAALVLVLVPAISLSLYAALGRPDLASPPRQTDETGVPQPNMAALVAELGRRLQDRPNDATGWALYARSLAGLGRFEEAEPAFVKALALDPANVELASRYAEAQIFAAGGIITPAARKTLESVLSRNPAEPRARYYLGLAHMQAGENAAALERWLALEADSPADAPWRPVLAERIAKLARELKIDPAQLAARRAAAGKAGRTAPRTTPGLSAAEVEAANSLSADERSAMIRSMVARLAARLEAEPDDADGWMRLGRSYGVLGERVKARDALAKAAALRPADVSVQVAYLEAMVNAVPPEAPMPAEMGGLAERILALDPEQPAALWYAGMARRLAGDTAGARALWTRLLSRLDPASPQHADLVKRLEALGATPHRP